MKPQSVKSELASKLKEVLKDDIEDLNDYRGDLSCYVPKAKIKEVCLKLKEHKDLDFNQMIDLTAVDYLNQTYPHRFEVVYHFLSLSFLHRLRVKVKVFENDLHVPSIHDVWLAVNWYERECYDMYGILFDGHPNLKRILMYEEFEGHPLRKDYPIDKEQPLLDLKDIKERNNYSKRGIDYEY